MLGNMKKFESLHDGSFSNTALAAESNELGGASGYGLRENPKRTWRATEVTFNVPQERICKQCGKGFQSLKALCGHMACHSDKEKVSRENYTRENSKLVDSDSDSDEDLIRQTRSKTKKYKKTIVKSSEFGNSTNGYSSICEDEKQEVENAAMCLMMLSKDPRSWGGINSIVEYSDNNSVLLETKSSSIDMKVGRNDELLKINKFGDRKFKSSVVDNESFEFENSSSGYQRNGASRVESDISINEFLRNGEYKDADLGMIYNRGNKNDTDTFKGLDAEKEFADVALSSKKRVTYGYDSVESSKNAPNKRKYDCVTCNKSFNSFQALGGHRPCNKRTNPTFHLDYESDDDSLEDDNIAPNRELGEPYYTKKPVRKEKVQPKKIKGHKCPFCPKIFKNGQALGGHKRTHFINAPEINQNAVAQETTAAAARRELIDLNLPAPEQGDEFDNNNNKLLNLD